MGKKAASLFAIPTLIAGFFLGSALSGTGAAIPTPQPTTTNVPSPEPTAPSCPRSGVAYTTHLNQEDRFDVKIELKAQNCSKKSVWVNVNWVPGEYENTHRRKFEVPVVLKKIKPGQSVSLGTLKSKQVFK